MSLTEKHRWGALPLLLADTLTLFCLLAGGLGSYFSTSQFNVEPGFLILWCALLSLGGAAMHTLRFGSWAALGLLALEGLLVWRYWENLCFSGWMGGGSAEAGGMEFALLAAALALLLGWVVVRARCWYLAALAVMTPLLPSILRGVLPDWTALLVCTAGWLSMLLTAFYGRRDKPSLARGQLLNLGGAAALLLLLTAVLPQEGYERPQWASDTRSKIADALSGKMDAALDWQFTLNGYLELDGMGLNIGPGVRPYFAVNDGGRVDLTAAGPRRYTNRAVLEITTEASQAGERVYLFGGSAMDYTGSSWESGPSYEPSAGQPYPQQYPALTTLEIPEKTMTIRHLAAAGDTAFYPYQLVDFQDNAAELSGDGPARRKKSRLSYQVSYRSGTLFDIFTLLDASSGEEAYREYVYDNYLSVPEETQRILQPVLDYMEKAIPRAYAILLMPGQYMYAIDCCSRTAEVLSVLAQYDIDTPTASPEEDFVEHFLDEGRGYCVHFATAGALLLRMQGIPARYASGYTACLDREGSAVVKDRDAHAWVEIYLDGYGWYPVEMTPGTFRRIAAAAEEDAQTPPAEEEPGVPEKPDMPEDTGGPEQTPEPPEPDVPAPEDGEDAPMPGGEDAPAQQDPLDLRWLCGAAAVLLVLAVPAAVYRVGLLARRKSRAQPDTNQSCICAYRRCLRTAAWGGEMPEVLAELAQKAKFSQHRMTDEERETAWRLGEDAFQELSGRLPWWRRAVLLCLRPLF